MMHKMARVFAETLSSRVIELPNVRKQWIL